MDKHDNVKLIIGLGNPGAEHETSRHNVGFMALKRFAEKYFPMPVGKFKSSVIIKGHTKEGRLILAWPLTYMNVSGRAALELRAYFKIDPESNLLVVHDDMDIPLGKIKVSVGGGAAGHNGVSSIIMAVGAKFARARVGIGRPVKTDGSLPQGINVDYVLRSFAREEEPDLEKGLELAAEAINSWLNEGSALTQMRYNKKTRERTRKVAEGQSVPAPAREGAEGPSGPDPAPKGAEGQSVSAAGGAEAFPAADGENSPEAALSAPPGALSPPEGDASA
ncbi:MAG: aminoacyl-tRNA hydrolase [Deltaproteobacteria bacterium]|jgi:PTH1 family peptidyl-tRNA hydrolase|nr:aminoacyl-tRNA hydrolase [Deltaproteobacteria bacterium]